MKGRKAVRWEGRAEFGSHARDIGANARRQKAIMFPHSDPLRRALSAPGPCCWAHSRFLDQAEARVRRVRKEGRPVLPREASSAPRAGDGVAFCLGPVSLFCHNADFESSFESLSLFLFLSEAPTAQLLFCEMVCSGSKRLVEMVELAVQIAVLCVQV